MQQQQQLISRVSHHTLFSYTSCKNMDEKSRINRQYRKSAVPRLRWTPELHRHFVQSVHSLGGKFRATPKKILQMMGVKGLKITHVKSHLQMYRSMKDSDNFFSLHMINYQQEKRPDFTTCRLPLLQVWEAGFREAPPHHAKQVKFPSAKITHQMGANLFYHQYGHQVVGTQGSSISAEISKENMKLGGVSEINFLGLGQTSESSTVTSPINLDLTMSSY